MTAKGAPKVWIDLANSPHVPLFEPVVERLEREGWSVCLTARRHAQTVELAEARWPAIRVVGGESPGGRAAKARVLAQRVAALRRFARSERPDVALSHGSYAQILAARTASIPTVTMMDYEHQPANHLSFRLADRIIVPAVFPEAALRRFGAAAAKTRRYDGFKEEIYLAGFRPDASVIEVLGLDRSRIIVVMRPAPRGALYHRGGNDWFDGLVETARQRPDVQVVILPRSRDQVERYGSLAGVIVPLRAVDGRSLLALADLVIGAGGTMSRESALLGTPTYTVFAGRLAAVDAALIERGLLHDLRGVQQAPPLVKKQNGSAPRMPQASGVSLADVVVLTLGDVVRT
jgi:predicted glycosyltransferase